MKRADVIEARSVLIQAMVDEILRSSEGEVSDSIIQAMYNDATALCLKWGFVDWPGLPGTFEVNRKASS